MKKFVIFGLLLLTACGSHVNSTPPPSNTEVVIDKVPVPVLCKAEIERLKADIDTAEQGMPLEAQNAMLRTTIAQQKAYIAALEAGIIGCGGKIND